MTAVDYVVIGLYALGMLAVGAFYARRTRTADDYLLGGRNMSPWLIGLSLFATLLSTLTYLALPGEMIKNGPMIFSQFAALPIALLIVGWVLIPRIMGQSVTSGYQLLEARLGVTGRLLGSGMFVALRIIWMASILYATTDKILLPLLGLGREWLPLWCTVMGLITILYTAGGGLRAVVVTDAMQAFLMFVGAVVTVALISWRLGGVEAWWPSAWPDNWQQPAFWPGNGVRISFVGAVVGTLVWTVCTAGSDQMAIQRYLATRDVRTARRSYAVNVTTVILSSTLLGITGLAVLGYFQARPQDLPAGSTALGDADRLLPHFIVIGLPPGMTGLVIAAILSAAMSSLSSGMNSSCAVITTDFIARWRNAGSRQEPDPEPPFSQHVTSAPAVTGITPAPGGGNEDTGQAREVRTARYVAVVVGVVAVLLSTVVGGLADNLLELCWKVVNLLTAPLFVLFFLALFVPWSTPFGAILATTASVGTAVAIAFFGAFGLSFLWIPPVSLVAGIAVGMLASLVPVPIEPWEAGHSPRD